MSPGPWVTRQNGMHVPPPYVPALPGEALPPASRSGLRTPETPPSIATHPVTCTRAPCDARSSGGTASDPSAGAAGLPVFAIRNALPVGKSSTDRSTRDPRVLSLPSYAYSGTPVALLHRGETGAQRVRPDHLKENIRNGGCLCSLPATVCCKPPLVALFCVGPPLWAVHDAPCDCCCIPAVALVPYRLGTVAPHSGL